MVEELLGKAGVEATRGKWKMFNMKKRIMIADAY